MERPEKACEDGRVLECGDMAECAACGREVRWDLRSHPFWGFQTCPDLSSAAEARRKEASGEG